MKPENDIRQFFRKAAAGAHPAMDEKVLAKVLAAHETTNPIDPIPIRSNVRSTIMRSPITKLGIAAAVIAVIGLGILEFIGIDTKSGVIWAEVARKVEANRGFMYQMRIKVIRPDRPDESCYITTCNTGSQLRQEWRLQPEGQLFRSQYYDFEAQTLVEVNHASKTCLRVPIDERTNQSQESGWRNAKDWVRQFLASKYTKLGHRTIEGVLCEGIETTDPTFGGYADPPPASLVARLWVSVETGYPFRLEYHSAHTNTDGEVQVEAAFDEFQWDVDLTPSLFEPNIPPDYKQRP